MLLMTPGPTRVPERVLRAGARPMMHHRSREFSKELATALELLRPVFGTRNAILPVHTTGRGALEAAICNLFSPGDEIAATCNGRFGEMWATFAESYGVVVHRIASDWTRKRRAAGRRAGAGRASAGARGGRGVLRHVDQRRGRRPHGGASRERTRRDGDGGRDVVDRRDAVCVRRVGSGRRHRRLAEVLDVEPGTGLRGAERSSMEGDDDRAAAAQLLQLRGNSGDCQQASTGNAGHGARASRAAGRRGIAAHS